MRGRARTKQCITVFRRVQPRCESYFSPTRPGAYYMAKQEPIKEGGIVTDALPNARFRVELDNGHEILGFLSGKMRKFFIKILPGDRVDVEMSPYDLTKGRIVYRYKG